MKTIAILGAGVTGLSIAQLLKDKANVIVLEKDSSPGGIAKTRTIDGATYHTVGGHCFNSKYPEVMDFVFNLRPQNQWHKTQRISKIDLGGIEISYPIEFAIKELYTTDPQRAIEFTKDFLNAEDKGHYDNLEDWFIQHFGESLCQSYFIPYNTKIWGERPKNMDYKWVVDKLPIPDKNSFFKALVDNASDTMPHSSFYYPNSNNQNELISSLADGLDIACSTPVKEIRKDNDKWIINGNIEADIVISTIPLNVLPFLISGAPDIVRNQASLLKYNKVSNVFWKSKLTQKTWTYKPSADTIFHRYIHIGSFFKPQQGYTITECIGEHSFEEMVSYGSKDPFLIEPLDHNISEHAYVVFDENRDNAVSTISSYLDTIGIYSIGRFGRWEYYNMDICMLDSMKTASEISKSL